MCGGNTTITWWRHQMETFSALLAICAGNSPASGEFPAQRPVTRSFDVFFDLCLNKRLRKQSWGWWFETLSRPLWRHCNDMEPLLEACNILKIEDTFELICLGFIINKYMLSIYWRGTVVYNLTKFEIMVVFIIFRITEEVPVTELDIAINLLRVDVMLKWIRLIWYNPCAFTNHLS